MSSRRLRGIRTRDPTYAVAWSPDGALVACAGGIGSGSLDVREPGDLEPVPAWSRFVFRAALDAVAWDRAGERMAVAGSLDPVVRVLAAGEARPALELDAGGPGAWCVEWGPDGQLAVSSAGKAVLLYERDGRRVAELGGHDEPVTAARWSPDGARLASCSYDGFVRLWDTRTGRCQRVVRPGTASEQTSGVVDLAWRPDGQQLAVVGNRAIHILDARTLWPVRARAPTHLDWGERSVAWSPDGNTVAATGPCVRLLDVREGRGEMEIEGLPRGEGDFRDSPDVAYDAAFSPCSKRLAVAAYDRTYLLTL